MQHDILLVDDDPSMIQMLGRALSGTGQLRFATSGAAALRQVREFPPDLVLLDAQMPGMDGYRVCEEMKADPLLASIPIIFVTGEGGQEFELRGLELGAADFIAKPFSPLLLKARVETQLRVKRLTDELRNIATTDALTGLANRRIFDTTLDQECQRTARNGSSLCLLMIDVDHFKLYNDREGHPAGDECLRQVARVFYAAGQRAGDLVARIGGEEFAILLPETPPAGALQIGQRVLQAIRQAAIPHLSSPTASHLTVSIGVGCLAGTGIVVPAGVALASDPVRPAAAELLHRADEALYAAKRAGRDRIASLGPEAADAAQKTLPASARPAEECVQEAV
ncbi:MAG: diguanylate cyclase [Gammaproteobacteria bacterium]|nr:diguanylate cyclase [Gammaproteobacteria bacterium]MBU1440974.1 diguanylate cyclase [Gammaproteobacteria bacterium]MBU2285467.1 diguanylate cyclase [Gammaproteobacteria bacterium]MBU2409838.1 diguanylate cyclase [Gammaproteobacteria bacterium]